MSVKTIVHDVDLATDEPFEEGLLLIVKHFVPVLVPMKLVRLFRPEAFVVLFGCCRHLLPILHMCVTNVVFGWMEHFAGQLLCAHSSFLEIVRCTGLVVDLRIVLENCMNNIETDGEKIKQRKSNRYSQQSLLPCNRRMTCLSSSMEIEATFICVYCLQVNEIVVDGAGGLKQEYIEDCQVCCRPNNLIITVDEAMREASIDAEQS